MIACDDCQNYSVCSDEDKGTICDAYEQKPSRYQPTPRMSMYERTKAQVYATGNKWAIENFNATHN